MVGGGVGVANEMKEKSKEFAMEEIDRTSSYSPPVDRLLTYGEADVVEADDWPNYLELGLGPEHIPDLIRMATDEKLNEADRDSLEFWAPIHAWRALGQLRAEAAIEPLLSLFDLLDDSEWVMEELPEVFGMIGPAALPALAAYMADRSHKKWPLINASSSVQSIATRWPEARSESVAILSKQLEQFAENDPEFNAFLILALVHLEAKEAAPLMEQAFAADRVEYFVLGDWDDVQVRLGLKSAEEVEQRRSERIAETLPPSTAREMTVPQVSSEPRRRSEAALRKKTKNKMAKQSRKKNRKR